MRIKELRDNFLTNGIERHKYAEAIFSELEKLLDIPELLKNSYTSEIVINKQAVLFGITEKDTYGNPYTIKMRLWEKDAAAVPVTVTSFGQYEQSELNLVSNLLRYIPKGGIVLDIGANLGWYSLNIKEQRPDIQIHAFEPVSETYKKLKYNIDINELDIHTYNCGLYSEKTEISFFYDITASGASSMRDLRESEATTEEIVSMRMLDDIISEYSISGIDFIKCDVEGSELFVYQGGENSIRKYKPIVFSEMLRKWSAKFGYHPNDIISFFSDLGYLCFVINEQGKLSKFTQVTDDTIETNYFFLHKEKHENIIKEMM